ncbi:MAG: hypothetical protein KIT87_11390 [Anaerolineae bacterium]|nr:hypothetical protein [Anaerolineae bacterium]
MGRLVTIDGTGTERSRLRRTIAEALRLLGQKGVIDDEARDLAALILLSLRQIAQGVDMSASAWEKRDYYMKADRFRLEWDWVERSAKELEKVLLEGRWNDLPLVLAKLLPRFSDIKLTKMTRTSALWDGAYAKLLKEGVKEKAAAR